MRRIADAECEAKFDPTTRVLMLLGRSSLMRVTASKRGR